MLLFKLVFKLLYTYVFKYIIKYLGIFGYRAITNVLPMIINTIKLLLPKDTHSAILMLLSFMVGVCIRYSEDGNKDFNNYYADRATKVLVNNLSEVDKYAQRYREIQNLFNAVPTEVHTDVPSTYDGCSNPYNRVLEQQRGFNKPIEQGSYESSKARGLQSSDHKRPEENLYSELFRKSNIRAKELARIADEAIASNALCVSSYKALQDSITTN